MKINKKGISLIVLVITIIVIIILAGAVILSLANNNPISQTSESVFKTNVSAYNSELAMAISNEYLQDYSFDSSTLNAGIWNGTEDNITGTIKKYIPSISVTDGTKFTIQNGKLMYVGTDNIKESEWAEDIGILKIINSTSTLWQFDSVTRTITKYLGSDVATISTITIPNYIDGIPVKKISGVYIPRQITSMFSNAANLKEIIISEGIRDIGDYTFFNCSNLINITMPSNLENIGISTFDGCSNLINVAIPSGLKNIGRYAFDGCSKLSTIAIPGSVISIGEGVFRCCNKLTNIEVDQNNSYYSTYDGVLFNKDKSIIICYPNSKTQTVYEILDGVTTINIYAFYECSNLVNITIPNTVTSIGKSAFTYCSSLTNITIPNSVTIMGSHVFYECSSLANITIPNGLKIIDQCTFFNCSNLINITIPSSVTSIGGYAFSGCNKLTNITINKPSWSINGSPWGAPNSPAITWIG